MIRSYKFCIARAMVGMALFALATFGACSKDEATVTQATPTPKPTRTTTQVLPDECLETAEWQPEVTGASTDNHDPEVEVTKTVKTKTGPLIGLEDPAPPSKEITFEIDMSEDLGTNGSLALNARLTEFPSSDYDGNGFPLLVYLSDGENDLINLTRSGESGDCADAGYFSCSGSSCPSNDDCTIESPSAYPDRTDWQQFQILPFGYVSSNIFPTCDWSSGSPACAFNSDLFDDGKLRSGAGVTYTAKYVVLASDYSQLPDETIELELTVITKKDATARAALENGAVDFNVILIGDKNIEDSQTTKGATNLNELFNTVQTIFNQEGTAIRIGKMRAYEFTCEELKDEFADVDVTALEDMWSTGTTYIDSNLEAKSINIFIVSSIPYSAANLTILGVSGGIKGPLINETGASGLAFASFDQLAEFNPDCESSDTACPASIQEPSFRDMGATIAHEIGHFLGLNHPTELDGDLHDTVPDTPECDAESVGGQFVVTHDSCLEEPDCNVDCGGYDGVTTFCPEAASCQFNHTMWYTTKNYSDDDEDGDGNIFSADSSAILNYNPFVR